jgi:hypothetical protein
MQDRTADQLHVKVTHVENAASGLAHYGEGFHREFIEDFLQCVVLLFLDPLYAFGSFFRFGVGNFGARKGCRAVAQAAQALLNALPELVRFGAQFGVGELLHLRLKGIDGRDSGLRVLDVPLVLGPEDLAYQRINQTVKSFGGRRNTLGYLF